MFCCTIAFHRESGLCNKVNEFSFLAEVSNKFRASHEQMTRAGNTRGVFETQSKHYYKFNFINILKQYNKHISKRARFSLE